MPLPDQTSLLKRNTYLLLEESKHESKRSEGRSVDEDRSIVTSSFFKADPQRSYISPLTFPHHGCACVGTETEKFASPEIMLLYTDSENFFQLKRFKRIHICLDSCRETSEWKEKIPIFLLPDFPYAEHRPAIVLLCIPQREVGLKTSGLVTSRLAWMKIPI